MRIGSLAGAAAFFAGAIGAVLVPLNSRVHGAELSGSVALTGQVSSQEEGPMEGVLVSAKKAGSTITTTVVTDASGRYNFPRTRLDAGQYNLRIRAVGYELDDPGTVEIGGEKQATADLKLHRAKDLSSQITNSEWLMSMPGTQAQKTALLNCVSCHTLERIVKSKHDTDQFLQVLDRMGSYANQSFPLHIQKRKADRLLEERGEQRQQARQRQAAYLASINLSAKAAVDFDLKTLARPKGKATRVIITEYDLPRRTVEPHDVVLDSEGMAWYSNFGEQAVGRLDPKTGKVTEFSVPIEKQGWPTGELGLQMDRDENLWYGMMFQAGVAKLDRKTGQFQVFTLPADWNRDMSQVNMAAPQSSKVDGKVWMQNNGFAAVHRLDLASGKIETFNVFGTSKEGENHNIYDVIPDSRNNAYFTDFANEHIGRIDAKTGEVKLYPTPTHGSAHRAAPERTESRVVCCSRCCSGRGLTAGAAALRRSSTRRPRRRHRDS